MVDEDAFRIIEVEHEPVSRVSREQALETVHRYRGEAGFEALISDVLVERFCALSRQAEPNEWLGILVGRVGEDDRGSYVIVDGIILDRNAFATPGHVRSTFLGERTVREIAALAYLGSSLIGWGHGHVRCGTHFSGGDRDNQATWSASYALGIVCDPRTPERIGVYRGPGSERLRFVGMLTHPSSREEDVGDSAIRLLPPDSMRSIQPSRLETRTPASKVDSRPSWRRTNARKVFSLAALLGLLWWEWHMSVRLSEIHARLEVLEPTVRTLDDQQSERLTPTTSYEPLMSLAPSGSETVDENQCLAQPKRRKRHGR